MTESVIYSLFIVQSWYIKTDFSWFREKLFICRSNQSSSESRDQLSIRVQTLYYNQLLYWTQSQSENIKEQKISLLFFFFFFFSIIVFFQISVFFQLSSSQISVLNRSRLKRFRRVLNFLLFFLFDFFLLCLIVVRAWDFQHSAESICIYKKAISSAIIIAAFF